MDQGRQQHPKARQGPDTQAVPPTLSSPTCFLHPRPPVFSSTGCGLPSLHQPLPPPSKQLLHSTSNTHLNPCPFLISTEIWKDSLLSFHLDPRTRSWHATFRFHLAGDLQKRRIQFTSVLKDVLKLFKPLLLFQNIKFCQIIKCSISSSQLSPNL